MQAAHKARLVDAFYPVMGLHVAVGRAQVAVEVAGRQQGRGQQLGIGNFAMGVIFSADGMEEIVVEAVYGKGLFCRGIQ